MNMKKVKNTIKGLFLATTILLTVSCSNDDNSNTNEVVIEASALPETARNFISTHFPDATYRRIEKQSIPDDDGSIYDVYLSNGFEIDFDANGNWTDVNGGNTAIPTAIIPEPITAYVTANYPNLFITTIEIEPTGYDVELSNDLDLVFNPQGEFVRIGN